METARSGQVGKALGALRGLLLKGAFAPGERLSEPALSDRLAISRTPLREAIGRLIEEGLLERVASGGCRVSSYSMQDIVDAIEVRGTLEGLAARLAAERGVSGDRAAEAHGILGRLDDAVSLRGGVDFAEYVALNADFHRWMNRAADSAVVTREVERVSRLPLASPSAFLSGQEAVPEFRQSLIAAQAQHRAILDAIEAREGARAEALAREHARLARHNLKFAMSEGSDMISRIPGLALVSAS